MNRERGSILVLTLIGVLVLSLMATGLLTVGSTEVNTTQNFYLNKFAYYTALGGVEEIRSQVSINPNPEYLHTILRTSNNPIDDPVNGTLQETDGVKRYYITGSLYNLQKNEPRHLEEEKGKIPPHQPAGMSISTQTSIIPIVFRVVVTAEAATGRRKGYSQIEAGVYAFITGY
jgi:hypothetical protein